MIDVSSFDGLNSRSRQRFGRPVDQLTIAELTALYRERGIMPPGEPDLRLVPKPPPEDDAPD